MASMETHLVLAPLLSRGRTNSPQVVFQLSRTFKGDLEQMLQPVMDSWQPSIS